MNTVCFYFEVHQPYRLKPYDFFQIGHDPFYEDETLNKEVLLKVANKCYLPTTELLLELVNKYGDDFQITFSITGTAMEQFDRWCPQVLDNFRRLAATGRVEFLAETYYHSLCGLFSENEFRAQVSEHCDLMERELGVRPKSFRNTELIFSDHIAWLVRDMGFETMLMEGAESVLGWRSPNFLYNHAHQKDLKLLLKNYKLSDDIAFRFSEKSWDEHPLSAEKFANWLHGHAGDGEVFNLFMDFETFGEHQWEDSGIFEFMRHLPEKVMQHPDFKFRTVTQTAELHNSVGSVQTHNPVSWADTERDLTAWMGNSIQNQALDALYSLEGEVKNLNDPATLALFRKLQTSDHFYYMCTKYFNDGDVHKYFSPYDSPYDAYIYFMNVLQDFRLRLASMAPPEPVKIQEIKEAQEIQEIPKVTPSPMPQKTQKTEIERSISQ